MNSVAVEIICPECGHNNDFWGIVEDGEIVEHYGRRCKGAFENLDDGEILACGFRFRFKRCEACGQEQDIAARICTGCQHLLVDNDTKLKEAMSLKDAHIMRPDTMHFTKSFDKKGREKVEVRYYDYDGEFLSEIFYLNTPEDSRAFYFNFTRMHNRLPERKLDIKNADDVIKLQTLFRKPQYVIARKQKYFWEIREKIF